MKNTALKPCDTSIFMPATQAPERCPLMLRGVCAGDSLKARLAAMGICVGMRLEVCRNMRHGPMLLACNGCRIMLGRGMAEKLMVEVCNKR